MAKKLQRNFIGFEQDQDYIKLAKKRLKNTEPLSDEVVTMKKSRRDLPKVPFGELVEQGIIPPGAVLTDKKERFKATVGIDGTLKTENLSGSIHQLGAKVQGLPSCNGWDFWHIKNKTKSTLLDDIRSDYRNKKFIWINSSTRSKSARTSKLQWLGFLACKKQIKNNFIR